MSTPEPESKRAFFYGTLMHPRILKRILCNDGSHLRLCPAVLTGYTRHKVKGENYPGVIPLSKARDLLGDDVDRLTASERVVRGTLVEGLTERDMKNLDDFEDIATDEYIRVSEVVHPLAPFHPMEAHSEDEDGLIGLHASGLIPGDMDFGRPGVGVDTYIYQRLDCLEKELWSFDGFVRNHASLWFEYTVEKEAAAGPA